MQSPTRRRLLKLNILAFASLSTGAVYTYYRYTNNNKNTSTTSNTALNKHSFTPYTLLSREKVSETSSILRLRAPPGLSQKDKDDEEKWKGCLWRKGVWSVEVKQPQLMIARRYTPLPFFGLGAGAGAGCATDASDPSSISKSTPGAAAKTGPTELEGPTEIEDLTILLRREPHGEVSRYLSHLPLNSAVEIRGGFKEYNIHPDVRDVVFLAGGTGIAPALQAARCLRERKDARLTVLWANRRRADCVGGDNAEGQGQEEAGSSGLWRWLGWERRSVTPVQELPSAEKSLIVRQLDALSARSKHEVAEHSSGLSLRARYFVDEEKSFLQQKDLVRALKSHDTDSKAVTAHRKLIIVSGPDGFVEYVAGAKRLVNGVETQGQLRGLLSKVDLSGWEVHKL